MLKQIGALPLRKARHGKLEVLLVSSRDTGRWVIPKGWRSKRLSARKAAAREAREEAGVRGKLARSPCGSYLYRKQLRGKMRLIEVDVFALKVRQQKKSWPERKQRKRSWFDVETASMLVREPKLRALIAGLSQDRPIT